MFFSGPRPGPNGPGADRPPPWLIPIRSAMSVSHANPFLLVALARVPHLFPFRTQQLRPAAAMVLPHWEAGE